MRSVGSNARMGERWIFWERREGRIREMHVLRRRERELCGVFWELERDDASNKGKRVLES